MLRINGDSKSCNGMGDDDVCVCVCVCGGVNVNVSLFLNKNMLCFIKSALIPAFIHYICFSVVSVVFKSL